MLLEFQFQNYKSFHGATSFSMKAESEQHGLDYSLFEVAGDTKVLCCSAIYGSNAAGKTSIISAMDTFLVCDGENGYKAKFHFSATNSCVFPSC